jgi:glycosyltransferase involved in cell wall biosynthesis
MVDVREAHDLAKKQPGEVLIGTVATLRPEKNLGLLIEAFARLPKAAVRLFVIGAGPELERLRELARRAGVADRVVFFGHTREPERILRALDIFAMSSNTEQMPIGLLEAMACGLPVAATDVGDIRRMVADDNRKLITPAGDPGALAASLRKLIEDTGARAWLGSGNLAKVRAEYDQTLMFERYAKLFG